MAAEVGDIYWGLSATASDFFRCTAVTFRFFTSDRTPEEKDEQIDSMNKKNVRSVEDISGHSNDD